MRKIALFALLGAMCFAVAQPASAHEGRLVAGKYHFTVGWGDEPTFAGFKNSVQLLIEDANHKPVNDLTDTLKVEVSTGDQKTTLTMGPSFKVGVYGDEGDYRADIIPTRAGNYTFKFSGTIRGDTINETFASSDKTFSPVESQDGVQFPAKDPSAGDLNARLTREAARLADDAKQAKDDAGTARTVGIVGIALGAVGIMFGLAARRR